MMDEKEPPLTDAELRAIRTLLAAIQQAEIEGEPEPVPPPFIRSDDAD
jgi:hypothetical protein